MNKKEIITVSLSRSEITTLLETLHFAQQAASVLAQEELKKSNGIKTAQKMKNIVENSSTLYKIFYLNFDIGEPPTDTMM